MLYDAYHNGKKVAKDLTEKGALDMVMDNENHTMRPQSQQTDPTERDSTTY